MNIAVAGCGIGGLAAACLLRDQGHDVTIFDAFDRPRPVGAGLIIQPTGQHVLSMLGVLGPAVSYGRKITHLYGETLTGKVALDARYDAARDDQFGLGIHRGVLFELLMKAAEVRDVKIVPSSRILDATPTRDTYLRIEGARQAGPFDLVVDAAGHDSGLSPLRPKKLPFGALWTVVDLPNELDPGDRLEQRYDAGRTMAGILPIGASPTDPIKKAAIFWSLRRDRHRNWSRADIEDWKAEASAFWPKFGRLVQEISCHEEMVYSTYAHGALLKPFKNRVVHIGDAAHQTSPQLGQGANHALIDAAVLSGALDRSVSPTQAFLRYSTQRMAHVRGYQAVSRVATPMYQSRFLLMPLLRDYVVTPLTRLGGFKNATAKLICGEGFPRYGLPKEQLSGSEDHIPLHGPGE